MKARLNNFQNKPPSYPTNCPVKSNQPCQLCKRAPKWKSKWSSWSSSVSKWPNQSGPSNKRSKRKTWKSWDSPRCHRPISCNAINAKELDSTSVNCPVSLVMVQVSYPIISISNSLSRSRTSLTSPSQLPFYKCHRWSNLSPSLMIMMNRLNRGSMWSKLATFSTLCRWDLQSPSRKKWL